MKRTLDDYVIIAEEHIARVKADTISPRYEEKMELAILLLHTYVMGYIDCRQKYKDELFGEE